MRLETVLISLGLCFSAATVRSNAAEIDVLSWGLSSHIAISGQGTNSDGTNVVTNGLLADFATTLGNSSAFSSINTSWDSQGFLDFAVEGEHACEGTPTLARCSSGGTFNFIPQVDSLITTSGEYNYMLGSGSRDAVLSVSVVDIATLTPVYWDFQRRTTLVHPPNGQMTHHSEGVLLTAGFEYALQYRLSLTSTTGSPIDLSMGDGFVTVAITPIPSPATAALLAVLFPLILRRSRRPPPTPIQDGGCHLGASRCQAVVESIRGILPSIYWASPLRARHVSFSDRPHLL